MMNDDLDERLPEFVESLRKIRSFFSILSMFNAIFAPLKKSCVTFALSLINSLIKVLKRTMRSKHLPILTRSWP